MPTIAFLGPEGTYTDAAAFKYAPNEERRPYPTLQHVTSALEAGEVDQAVVPIENSLGGTIIEIIDFLIHTETVRIRGELLLQIEHCLIAQPGARIEDIRVVMSKPEALLQCRKFLSDKLKYAEQLSSPSTAAAVAEVKDGDIRQAAIGPRRAAEISDLPILAEGIQDRANNVTRFVVLARSDHEPTGNDKTSIAFDFDREDAPGSLYAALKPFSDRDINLTKIESRPTGTEIGSYIFLLDFEGHATDSRVKEAIAELTQHTSTFKVMGSYPRADRLS